MDAGDEVTLKRFRKRKGPRPLKTDGQTDPYHFSELVTPQVQPLQLRQLLHAPANTHAHGGTLKKGKLLVLHKVASVKQTNKQMKDFN